MDKKSALAELVTKRRSEQHAEYHHLHTYDDGYWNFDFVVPWTKSVCNLDAKLMIVGQDWASEDFLLKHNSDEKRDKRKLTGQDEWLQTNRYLKELLKKHFDLEFSDVYATDVSIFIKPGTMSADIPMKDLLYCAEKYAVPQIEIIQPVMVLCLGAKTFKSVRCALGGKSISFKEACSPPPHTLCGKAEVYAVPHTGGQGIANARGKENVDKIWAELANWFK